jgi:hypothetical protein
MMIGSRFSMARNTLNTAKLAISTPLPRWKPRSQPTYRLPEDYAGAEEPIDP